MNTKYTFLKKCYVVALLVMIQLITSQQVFAQLSGNKSIPGDYGTIALAITDLNIAGVGPGGVTFNVAAGHTETLSGKITLTATGTLANPIVIQKSGAGTNPKITAYTGTVATPSVVADGFFVLAGSDYVTIDGIDLEESGANSTTTTMMEYGYGLFKASATNGCQNNIIRNCTITLNRLQNTTWTTPGFNGSTGIAVLNSLHNSASALTVTTAAGSNSNNKFYTNTIQNCNAGIVFVGFAATLGVGPAPTAGTFLGDLNNDVGGSSSATGNNILNFGGGAATNPSTGIHAASQWSMNCSYNTLNNNDGSGVDHTTTLRGINFATGATSAKLDCNYNNITLTGGGTTAQLSGIENQFGSTPLSSNTVNINNNTLAIEYRTATSGPLYGILSSGATPAILNINNNTISGIDYSATTLAGSGLVYGIQSSGSSASMTHNINGNSISNIARTGTSGGTTIGIFVSAGTTGMVVNANSNTISAFDIGGTGTGSNMFGIQTPTGTITCNNNNISNLQISKTSGTGQLYGIYNVASPVNETYNNNTISSLTNAGTGATWGMLFNTVAGTRTVSGNIIHTISAAGTTVGGMSHTTSSPNINKNKIYNIQSTSTGAPTVSGILVTSMGASGSATIHNNLIGDLKAPNASTTSTVPPSTAPTIRGINITATTTSSGVFIYYNTVLIEGTTSGTNFGTAALFVSGSSTSTTANLRLRNNILVNKCTAKGTGYAVAYQRSSTFLNNYDAVSNNNLYFAGTPSATNLICYDGTNSYQTLADFKAAMATRDAASVTENVQFTSTTGANSAFLQVVPGTASLAESGGAAISTFENDYAGTSVRNGYPKAGQVNGGGTAPDIGAYEYDGTPNAVCVAPTNQATGLTLTPASTTVNVSFTAASPAASGYLVVAASGAAPTNPVNGTSYSVGSTVLGAGTLVLYNGSATSFTGTGLTALTAYTIYVYAYNNAFCIGGPSYNTTSPISASTTTCIAAPSLNAITNLLTTSFSANWNAVSGATAYELDVSTASNFSSFVTGYNAQNVGNVTTFSITGLTQGTTYHFRVRAVTGTCTSSSGTNSVLTAVPMPFSESFASYPPANWLEATGALTSSATLTGTASTWLGSNFANVAGNTGFKINLYVNPGTVNDWVISPNIFIGSAGAMLKYRWALTGWNNTTSQSDFGSHTVRVVISTDGGSTWSTTNVIKTYSGTGSFSNSGVFDSVVLTGYSGTIRIGFLASFNTNAPDIDFHVDDVQVLGVPSCSTVPTPADLATGIALLPTLSWGTVSDATQYDVFLNSSTPTTTLLAGNLTSATHTVASALSPNTTYYWKVVPKNHIGSATGCTDWSFTTGAPSPTISAGTLNAFGNVCANVASNADSFTVSGAFLNANVEVGALAGYSYATTLNGTYTSTLSLAPSSGTLASTKVYVKFTPTSVATFNGNIAVTSTGATTQNVAVTGSGVGVSNPTLSSAGSAAVTSNSAANISNSTVSSTGCASITGYGIEYSTTNGFTTGTGTQVSGTGFSGAAGGTFNTSLTGLTSNTTYYYRSYATNSSGTAYSIQSSFKTPRSVPMTEAFASYPPTDWTEATGALSTSTTLTGTTSTWGSTNFANVAGNTGVKINLYNSSTTNTMNDWVISPVITLANTGATLVYRWALTDYNGTLVQSSFGSHTVRVVVSTDGGTTWSTNNVVKTYSGAGTYSNTGVFDTIVLSSHSGNVKIGFLATSQTSATTPDIDFHIDDFQLLGAPTACATAPSPGNAASGVAQLPTLSWTGAARATAYDVYLGTTTPATTLVSSNQSGTTYSPSTLNASTLYYWRIVPRNPYGAATACTTEWSFTTQAPVPTINTGTMDGFGSLCLNVTSAAKTFTVSGVNLTDSVEIGALAGYAYSTTENGTYTSSLKLNHTAGSLATTTIYVKFTPTSAISFNGNIAVTSTGATSQNIAVTGTGLGVSVPTVSVTGTATTTSATSASVSGTTISSIGCATVTAYGIEYSTTSGFTNGTGTQVAGTGFSGSNGGTFNTTITGLTTNTIYYFKSFATNSAGTTYSSEGSFNTRNLFYSVARNTGITYNSIMSFGTTYTSLTDADDGYTNLVSLTGTTFKYQGNPVTGFIATSNGWMTFNTSNTASTFTNNLTSTLQNRVLAPFWDDLVILGNNLTNLNASMRYTVIGTLGSGSADIVIEWADMERFNFNSPSINFQIVLHESDNSIDYNYGNMLLYNGSANHTEAYTYSVGMNGATPATAGTANRFILQRENTAFLTDASATSLGLSPACFTQLKFTPSFTSPTLTDPGAPVVANNEPATATVLSVNTAPCASTCNILYSSKTATASTGITTCTATTPGTADDDVWFSFSTTSATNYRIAVTPGIFYDAVVQVFSGSPGSLTSVTCINGGGQGITEEIASQTLASGTYYIRVYDAATGSSGSGEFGICVSEVIPPPSNDNPAGAVSLTIGTSCVNTASISPNTLSATATASITACSAATPGTPDDDIWYKFRTNAVTGTLYTMTAQGVGSYNAVLQLMDSATMTPVSCANASASNAVAETITSSSLAVNTTYYLRVYHAGPGAGSGNVNVCVFAAPPACITSPVFPTNAAEVCKTSPIILEWTTVTNATGYNVFLDSGNVTPSTLVSSAQAGLTYTPSTLAPGLYSWRVAPVNGSSAATSCTVWTFTITDDIANNSITGSAQTICSGATPSQINASTPTGGDGSSYTYSWLSSTTSGSSGFSLISSTNTQNYTPGALTQTTWFRRRVSSGACTLSESSSIQVTVNNDIASNSITSSAQSICSGSTPAQITASTPSGGDGSSYTYAWESSTTSSSTGFSAISSSNSVNYTPGSLTATTWFRRTVSSGVCATNRSSAIEVTVTPTIASNTIGTSQSILTGSTPNALTGSTPTGGTGTYTYAWIESSTSSTAGFAAAAGTNNTSGYAPGTLSQDMWYKRIVISGSCRDTSSAVSISVNANIAGNTVSSEQTICSGSTPNQLTGGTPTGGTGNFTYTWLSSTTSATAGFTAASGTNNGINYTPGSLTQNTWYRRYVDAGTATDTSSAVLITVNTVIANNTITSSAQTICDGTSASQINGSTPTGGNGSAYTYEWRSSTTSATTGFSAASGTNNGVNYSPGTLSQNTWFIRSVSSGACASDATSAIAVTVTSPVTSNTITSSAQTICSGATPTQITASTPAGGDGSSYTYSWQSSTTNATTGFSAISSTNTQNYTPGALTQTTWFRRSVTSGACSADITSAIQVTVNNAIANNNITSSAQTICSGATPTQITASTPTGGNGNNFTYQWQSSTTSATTGFAAAAGINDTVNYTPAALTQTTWFRRVVTSGVCSSSESGTLLVTVNNVIANNTISSSAQTICSGSTPAEITAGLPTGGDGSSYTYTWQRSTFGSTTGFSNISNSNTQNYTPPSLTQNTWYRRTVTSGICASSNSAAVAVTVNGAITNNLITSASSTTTCVYTDGGQITATLPAGGDGSSYTYEWQSSTTSASTGFAAASGTNNQQNYSPGTLTQTTWFRRRVTSGGCESTSSVVTKTVSTIDLSDVTLATGDRVWSGSSSTTWSTAGNWYTFGGSAFTVSTTAPASTDRVILSTGTCVTNQPTITTNIEIGNLVLRTGAIVSLGSTTTQLSGTVTGTGTWKGSTTSNMVVTGNVGTLRFDQTTPGTTNVLNRLTINSTGNTITLGNALRIVGSITPTAGTLATGGNLTLVSNAIGTATVNKSNCTTCSYITGNVTVERFIPANRRWRFLSSAVANSTLADWKNETHITGTGGSTNGFDNSFNNASSFMYFNEPTNSWLSPANINLSLETGRGYRAFIRGDRTASHLLQNSTTTSTVTLNNTGTLHQGNISMPVSRTGNGWCLLGNPYASPIDWNMIHDASRTGPSGSTQPTLFDFTGADYAHLGQTVWAFDPSTNSYSSFNALSNAGIGSLSSGIIRAGQAFFVYAGNSNPTLTIREDHKVDSNTNGMFKTTNNSGCTVELFQDSINKDYVKVMYINGSTTNNDVYDIMKMGSEIELSAWGADSIKLALTARPLTQVNDTIRLQVKVPSTGTYQLRFSNSQTIAILDNIHLIDNYTSQIIDLKSNPQYSFSVDNSIPNSTGRNRFYILVSTPGSVPVKLMTFNARTDDNKTVELGWATASEENSEAFDIERSFNGLEFETIGAVKAKGTSNSMVNYQFTDKTPEAVNYYRLRMVDKDGSYSYSDIRRVDIGTATVSGKEKMLLYPIPAQDNLKITLNNKEIIRTVKVYNAVGILIGTYKDVGRGELEMNVSGMSNGVYIIEVTNSEGQVMTSKFNVVK